MEVAAEAPIPPILPLLKLEQKLLVVQLEMTAVIPTISWCYYEICKNFTQVLVPVIPSVDVIQILVVVKVIVLVIHSVVVIIILVRVRLTVLVTQFVDATITRVVVSLIVLVTLSVAVIPTLVVVRVTVIVIISVAVIMYVQEYPTIHTVVVILNVLVSHM